MKTTKLLAVLSVALAVSSARATIDNYLYWMVYNANDGVSDVNFEYATIKGDGNLLNIYKPDSGTVVGTDVGSYEAIAGTGIGNSTYGAPSTGVYAGFESGSINTFLIELWVDTQRVGYQSYDLASVGNHIYSSGAVGTSALTVTDVVPEPTSGLLSLFGLAALALRRRRRA